MEKMASLMLIVSIINLLTNFASTDKEFLWRDKTSGSFRTEQKIGFQAFNNWNDEKGTGETFSVCNYDNLLQLNDLEKTTATVQNYLISPKVRVPTDANFVQLNYSMDITASKSQGESLKVLKYETTSNHANEEVKLSMFESFDFVNGEYFDLLDGNALLTIPVHKPYLVVALYDTGYCGSITIHSIHTNICPQQQDGSIVVPKMYSALSNKRISIDATSVTCIDDSKVVNFDDKIVKFCQFNGKWFTRTPKSRDQEFCGCELGFYAQFRDDGTIKCSRCAVGEVKSEVGNSFCEKCAPNSRPNTERTFCDCDRGYYRANVTNSKYKCHSPPVLPTHVKVDVQFTDVHISWTNSLASLLQWYSLKCLSCSTAQQTEMFEEQYSSIRYNPIVIHNLAPHTHYKVALEAHSEIVAPNKLVVPRLILQFTTSYKLTVSNAEVKVMGNRIHVTWDPPNTEGVTGIDKTKLKYKIDVMINHEKSFHSPEIQDTRFSYPLPTYTNDDSIPVSIRIGIINNGSVLWGDEVYASSVSLISPSVSRYVMAIGIMVSMLLLVAILVCGVICMVHRTRSIAKYEQNTWNTQPNPNHYFYGGTTDLSGSNSNPGPLLDHHHVITPYDYGSYSSYNLSNVQAFVEPSVYEDIFSVVADFCPALPPGSLQVGKRISESIFEGQIIGSLYCHTAIDCYVKLLTMQVDGSNLTGQNVQQQQQLINKNSRRFLIEAATMSQFHHCNVQKLHGLVLSDNIVESPYMEMAIEMCTRGSLKQCLNETPFWSNKQHSTVYFLLRGILHGMEYLHDLGYIHKVLKAKNVMVTENNVAKVSGFEERSYLEENDTATALDELDLVAWQPLEVIKHNKFTTAADVYSFAILFWEVLHDCQCEPFNNDNNKEIVIKTCEGKRPVIPKETPQWVEGIIASCWSDDLFKRPSISSVRKQLDSIIVNSSLSLSSSSNIINLQQQQQQPYLNNKAAHSLYVSPHSINSMQFNKVFNNNNDFFDLSKWLDSLKLEKLGDVFRKHGITTWEQISMLKDTDIASIPEINSKQRKKIVNSINQFNCKKSHNALFSTSSHGQTPPLDKLIDYHHFEQNV